MISNNNVSVVFCFDLLIYIVFCFILLFCVTLYYCSFLSVVMVELGVNFVETVLLSMSMFESEEEITVDLLRPHWQALEQLVAEERVLSLGISDLDKKKTG